MSPLRLGTLLTACAVSVLVLFALVVGAEDGRDLLPNGLLRILLCISIIAWIGHIAVVCQDHVTRTIGEHIDRRLDDLSDTITDYGDARAHQGLALGLRGPTKPAGRMSIVD